MNLVDKLNKELEKYNLKFEITKECNDKFNGKLIKKGVNEEIPYELYKSLQFNCINSHCKWINNYVDMYLKLKGEK